MRMIIAYVNPEKVWDLKKKLFEIGAPGMSIDNFLGIGKPMAKYKEIMEKHGAIPKFFPKTRVEIVCEDEEVDEIVTAIVTTCKTGNYGDGKIFVLPVENAIRIRTGETGKDALR
ncbi:nitrogen regulatory protein P-II 1 [Thermosulfidibacter takaii ABI70S6]|uniref:Nitrogen regulatory protein P-II 1 n=1 Tax=Thermosulfidibacter takaii (strain DSM 17441 / JCM 13301 / NBRC 103674 / ABI70S6) TaxID=1298851 RepID=A0A0S3QW16_THET7|nr:P-II family nitrogen regulator [Thermosulfidibacter takaii]BAT72515.1 nitrogen regulatory protein P-II 1 [Thermosulfidibacter takaii ABI70S6]